MLVTMDYTDVSVTGAFDENTQAAVALWQKQNGFTQDSVVNASVLKAMEQAETDWLNRQLDDPDFTFITFDTAGTTWTENKFAEHKLTMVNYWAYWCGPCRSEMPDLQKIYENYADKGVIVVGVMDGTQDDLDTLSSMGITYPNLYLTPEIEEVMSTGYLPTTIFVDSAGHIVGDAYVGSRSYEDWTDIIDGILK